MHQKRLNTLTLLVSAVLRSKKLSLTELGREINLPIQERSGIKRVDRFLGNKKLHKERIAIYQVIIKHMLTDSIRPNIIIDWSHVPNTRTHVIRAALALKGRAMTLYEEVHEEKS